MERQPLVADVSAVAELAHRARSSQDRPAGKDALDRMRDLADQIRAKVELDSHPGRGTRVTITVPT